LPSFTISGRLHRLHCPINLPFTGEVVIEQSEKEIKSIELQLVCVETIHTTSDVITEASQIQKIQIAEGDVPRNMTIPLYMIFPRLYCCPTLISQGSCSLPVGSFGYSCLHTYCLHIAEFRIEFEVNLIIVLGDGYMLTENFPLVLHREH
jgi:hypothetical protein